jgi:hypothetical protein
MKFDIEIDDNCDLSVFRGLFLKLVGTDQSTYNLFIDKAMVRFEVSGTKTNQLIVASIFNASKNETCRWDISGIYPLQDTRYQNLSFIKELFELSGACSCHIVCYNPLETFKTLEKLVRIVYKVNKLKAFI